MVCLRPSLEFVGSPTPSKSFLNDPSAFAVSSHPLVWPNDHAQIRTSSVLGSPGAWPCSLEPSHQSTIHRMKHKSHICLRTPCRKGRFDTNDSFICGGFRKGLHGWSGRGRETKQLPGQPATLPAMDNNYIPSTLSIKDHSANVHYFPFQLCNIWLTLLSY